jgi:preprotein translocase subunit SecY
LAAVNPNQQAKVNPNQQAKVNATPSAKALLEEVKQQYNNEFARKGTLETKANNTITIAGTIATLLFGFGTFLVDKLSTKYGLISPISILLLAAVVSIIISIVFSVWASRTQKYRYAISPVYFYNDSTNSFNDDNINRFKNFQDEVFCSKMINNYLRCIGKNHQINSSNAKKLRKSQIFFVIGMLPIPVIVFILLTTLTATSGTALPVNHDINLTVYRNGHAVDLKATLAASPSLLHFLTPRSGIPSIPHPLMRPPLIP